MSESLKEISYCEVCGHDSLTPVLDLGRHPMCDDLVPIGDSRVCREYPIEILFCERCITAHQRFQIPKYDLFPKTYHYRSRHTADVLNGMKQVVAACESALGPMTGKTVLDVGCNDGSLLSFFKDAGASSTYGIEPTGAAAEAANRGHTVLNDFLDEELAQQFVSLHGHPDIITFTNVFAHIEDLPQVVRSLLRLFHDRTVVVIENHYLGSIIDRRQFDTFYHEHPRSYSYTSLTYVAQSLGRQVSKVEFPSRYGGNIRVILQPTAGQPLHDRLLEIGPRETGFEKGLKAMAHEINIWKRRKRRLLQVETAAHGQLRAKAFPGRSAIPIKLLGLDETMIKAVHEKPGSAKVGHYVPGTRIPIFSDDDFDASQTEGPVINMAWHIADEISAYMQKVGYSGRLIDIIEMSDFEEGA
jgi:hypothetical protein